MNRELEKLLVAERATEWLTRLETGSPEDHAAFWKWVRESPVHVREALFAKAVDTMLSHLFQERRINVDNLVSKPTNVRKIQGDERSHVDSDALPVPPASRAPNLG